MDQARGGFAALASLRLWRHLTGRLTERVPHWREQAVPAIKAKRKVEEGVI